MNFDETAQGPQRALPSDSLDGKISSARSPAPAEIPESAIQPNDVLCGRGKTSFGHSGNRRFREIITSSIDRYNSAGSRLQKSLVVHQVVEQVHSIGGRFLKRQGSTRRWMELDDRQAKDKCGHALRDAISSIENSHQKKRKRSSSLEEDNLSRRSASSAAEMKMESPVERVTMQDAMSSGLYRPSSLHSQQFSARASATRTTTSSTDSYFPASELLPRPHSEPLPLLATSWTLQDPPGNSAAEALPLHTGSNPHVAVQPLQAQFEPRPLHPHHSHHPTNEFLGTDDTSFVEQINQVLGPFQQADPDEDTLSEPAGLDEFT